MEFKKQQASQSHRNPFPMTTPTTKLPNQATDILEFWEIVKSRNAAGLPLLQNSQLPGWFEYANYLDIDLTCQEDLNRLLCDRVFLSKVIQFSDDKTGEHITQLVPGIVPDRLFIMLP